MAQLYGPVLLCSRPAPSLPRSEGEPTGWVAEGDLSFYDRGMTFWRWLFCVWLLGVGAVLAQAPGEQSPLGAAAQQTPGYLAHAGVEQRLGQDLPAGTVWTDAQGHTATLHEWFAGKPVVFAEVYYKCAMLCPQVLHGLAAGLKSTTLTVGKDYDVLVFSIDPTDNPQSAALQKQQFLKEAGWALNPGAASAVHFLTGAQPAIDAVTAASGFHYVRVPGPDGRMDQFAHSSVVMFATPEGKMSRYLSGIDYQGRDLRLALLDASQRKISNPVDLLILYCCSYVPSVGRYTVSVTRILALAGMVSVAIVIGMVFLLARKPRVAA